VKVAADNALQLIPWGQVQALADELVEHGFDDEEVRLHIARILDDLLPADLLPPPFGTVAELLDGPVIVAAMNLVVAVARRDPVKRQARIARRNERRARRSA
jgi:hypothetical protein